MSYLVNLSWGAVGDTVCAIPALNKLSINNKVYVTTKFPSLFKHLEFVELIHPPTHNWSEFLKKESIQYIEPNPYRHEHFYSQNNHMTATYDFLLNNTSNHKPPILVPDSMVMLSAMNNLTAFRKDFKKICLYQPFSSMYDSEKDYDPMYKSLNKELAIDLVSDFKDTLFIHFGHTKISSHNVKTFNLPLEAYICLVHLCDFFLGIDSCLNHMGASTDTKGLFLFGSTELANFAYPDKFTYYQREGYPVERFYTTFHDMTSRPEENSDAMSFDKSDVIKIQEIIKDMVNK